LRYRQRGAPISNNQDHICANVDAICAGYFPTKLSAGGRIKTTLPKQMWDGILLQVSPVVAAASVVVLIVVIAMFAIIDFVQDPRLRSSA
jgi:ABC-type spermidine/putrescine transport system permease subunit I